jgi:Xaa-Pro aminopeptidase
LVQDAELTSASKPFLRFETLSLAPFDRRLIDPSMLDGWELAWLNAYHVLVANQVGPHLDAAARGWLANACREVSNAGRT